MVSPIDLKHKIINRISMLLSDKIVPLCLTRLPRTWLLLLRIPLNCKENLRINRAQPVTPTCRESGVLRRPPGCSSHEVLAESQDNVTDQSANRHPQDMT